MNVQEFYKWAAGSGLGVAVVIPVLRSAGQYFRRGRQRRADRDELLKATAASVATLVVESKSHNAKLDGVTERTTRLEFVLTGDKGENGVRGQVTKLETQVKDIRDLFVKAGVDAAIGKQPDRRKRQRRKSA